MAIDCCTRNKTRLTWLAIYWIVLNAFVCLYFSARLYGWLSDGLQGLIDEMHATVLPDVHNLDAYIVPPAGFHIVRGLAEISLAFELLLFIGIRYNVPQAMYLDYSWEMIDSAVDATIGTLSTRHPFFAPLRRDYNETFNYSIYEGLSGYEIPTEPTSTWKPFFSPKTPYNASIEYQRIEPEGPVNITKTEHALGMDAQKAGRRMLLCLHMGYVVFRLIFKIIALAWIRQYAAQLSEDQRFAKDMVVWAAAQMENQTMSNAPTRSRTTISRITNTFTGGQRTRAQTRPSWPPGGTGRGSPGPRTPFFSRGPRPSGQREPRPEIRFQHLIGPDTVDATLDFQEVIGTGTIERKPPGKAFSGLFHRQPSYNPNYPPTAPPLPPEPPKSTIDNTTTNPDKIIAKRRISLGSGFT